MSLIPLVLLAVDLWIPAKLPVDSRVAATLDGKAVEGVAREGRPRLIVVADFKGARPNALMAAMREVWDALRAEEPAEFRAVDYPPLEIVAAGDVPAVFARSGSRLGDSPVEARPMREENALEWMANRTPVARGPVRLVWVSESFDWCESMRKPAVDRFFTPGEPPREKLSGLVPPLPQLAASGLSIYPVWIRKESNSRGRELARTLADYSGGVFTETTLDAMAAGILDAVRRSREGSIVKLEEAPLSELGDTAPHQLRVWLPGGGDHRRLLMDRRQVLAPPLTVDWAPKLYTRSSELAVSAGCGTRPGRLKLTPAGDRIPVRARMFLRQMHPPGVQALIRRATFDVELTGGAACIDLPVIRPNDHWRIVAINDEDNWLGYSAFTVTERK